MRGKIRWIVPAVALLLASAFYAAYWLYAAGLVRQGIVDWIEARRHEGYTVGADRLAVSGFPFVLRARLDGAVLAQERAAPSYELRLPLLVAEAPPWSPRRWTLRGEQGGRFQLDPGPARPPVLITAVRLGGRIEPNPASSDLPPDGVSVELVGEDLVIQADDRLQLDRGTLTAGLPARGKVGHQQVWARTALRLEHLTLPHSAGPLGRSLDELALTAAVKGSVPSGTLRPALAAWRDEGGTLEVEQLRLAWGKLLALTTGTLALDPALQPEGAGTATVAGYNEILDALAGQGSLRPGDAALAKAGLGLLAKPGQDGRPQITAPLRIQNSEVYLGPARIGRLPRFTWE